jgi:hypothetical protein
MSVIPSFQTKLNTHSMCAHEPNFHIYRIENGYKITNITLYYIYYTNNVLHKTKSNTLDYIAVDKLHNSKGN